MGRVARDQRGTSSLEFALVVPVLLLLLFVGLDFSRVLLAYATIGNASREGARYAILHPDATGDDVAQVVRSYAGPLSPTALTVTVEYSADRRATFVTTPPAAQRNPRPVTVKVSVRYPWAATSGVAATFLVASAGTRTVAASAQMDMQR
jgi:Flp pilus assembly protein TadG